MAQRYGLKEYQDLGKRKGLEFIGENVPLAKETTKWKCVRCDSVWEKSFRAVSDNANGCRCTSAVTLSEDKYKTLARHYKLTWTPGPIKPRNTKSPTTWTLPNGEKLVCSYWQLGYVDKMPNFVKEALGLPFHKKGGAVNV